MRKITNTYVTGIMALILFLIAGSVLFEGCNSNQIVLENDYFKYVISGNGTNLQFIDKATGKNHLDTEAGTKFTSVSVDGSEHSASAVSFEDRQLHIAFGKTDISIQLDVNQSGDRITLKIKIQ